MRQRARIIGNRVNTDNLGLHGEFFSKKIDAVWQCFRDNHSVSMAPILGWVLCVQGEAVDTNSCQVWLDVCVTILNCP